MGKEAEVTNEAGMGFILITWSIQVMHFLQCVPEAITTTCTA